jgi:hypothetical protein
VTVFSPRLGRQLTLGTGAAHRLWLMIESDPQVFSFCERPLKMERAGGERVVDFWVQRSDRDEELLCLQRRPEPLDPPVWQGIMLRAVGDAELHAAQIWTSNWERIVAVLVATRGLVTAALRDSVFKRCERPISLAALQRLDLGPDMMLVRGAAFDLLHRGWLSADALRTSPLSPLTHFARAR